MPLLRRGFPILDWGTTHTAGSHGNGGFRS
jgi:hypothetical protein